MALPERAALWPASSPAAWPDPPAEMTVTSLTEIEACPRRWALGTASYPALWSGRGHPPRVQLNTLAGTVVHFTLETITKSLVRAECPSLQDALAIQVLKDLGGYTKLVNDHIDLALERLANNPRARSRLKYVARSLRQRVPNLRVRVQTMLSGLHLPQVTGSHSQRPASKPRGPLTVGVFPEIELRARQMGWKGKADLLILTEGRCEITDFKTGAPDECHRFQIGVYALLWSRDTELNPGRRLANRLILRYTSGDVEVPAPTASELDALEHSLIARRDAVGQAVSQLLPEARPNPDNCRYCGVRQLCNEYWTSDTQRQMAEQADDRRFADVEVTITGRHGPSSWDARVELSHSAPPETSAVLRTTEDTEFSAGKRVRILDAAVTVDDEDDTKPVVITLGKFSETYLVKGGAKLGHWGGVKVDHLGERTRF